MNIVKIVEDTTKFVQEKICDDITFYKPSDDAMGKTWTPGRVKPIAFPMFTPPKDMTLNGMTEFPSVCVQLMPSGANQITREQDISIRLIFGVWYPGPFSEKIEEGEEKVDSFTRNADGWKETFRFLDHAKDVIESNSLIGDFVIDKNIPLEFGPWMEDDTLVNSYPYFFSWLRFSIKSGTFIRRIESYEYL